MKIVWIVVNSAIELLKKPEPQGMILILLLKKSFINDLSVNTESSQ